MKRTIYVYILNGILLLSLISSENKAYCKITGNSVNIPGNRETICYLNRKLVGDFWIISITGSPDVKIAEREVEKLKGKGHKAGYLWVPDYESLSGKQVYVVYIGPFDDRDECVKYFGKCKKDYKDCYAVKVSHDKTRVVIFNKFDIRINDVKQYLILIYATPEDEEEYAENGGEDWGWFVNDVSEYFGKNYENKVYIESVYGSWFTDQEIQKLKQELELDGFGYVLVKGNSKMFVAHDMPDGVISSACDFFGLEFRNRGDE